MRTTHIDGSLALTLEERRKRFQQQLFCLEQIKTLFDIDLCNAGASYA